MQGHKQAFFKGVYFSYLYIFIYFFTGLLTTPILLNHFQSDYFALLMLVYAIITYLSNIRFGIPEFLAAFLAKSKDKALNRGMIKRSFILLIVAVIFSLSLILLIDLYIDDWRIVLGDVYLLKKSDVINVFYILIVFALLKIPLDLALSIFIGFHAVYLEKLYKILILLANFILVLLVAYFGISIVTFSLWAGLLDLLVSIVAFAHMLMQYKLFRKQEQTQDIKTLKLFKSGFLFFQISMTQTIIWGAGILFVSHMLSLQEVTIYSLTMKIYIYIFYAFVIINTVLAPLYGKYFAESAWDAINKAFHFMLLVLPFLGGLIWLGTLYFMPNVMAFWTRSHDFFIGPWFIFFVGIFFYFTGYVNSYITILYSIGQEKSMLYIRWSEVMLNLLASFIAVYFFGIIGVAIGISLAIVLTSVRYLPNIIKEKSDGKIFFNFSIQKKHFIVVLLPGVFIALLVALNIELLWIKTIIFTLTTACYIWLSWFILPLRDKELIIELLNQCRKDEN